MSKYVMGATVAPEKTATSYDGSTPLKNARHETFAHEYIIDQNATQAAIRAKYSPNGAYQRGYELLRNSEVWARVAYLRDERLKRSRRSAAEIIKELEKIAFSDISKVVSWDPDTGMTYLKGSDEIDPEISGAIESIQVEEKTIGKEGDTSMVLKTKVKLHPKLPALLALGKEHGLFKDKVEHSGSVAHVIEVVDYGDGKAKG